MHIMTNFLMMIPNSHYFSFPFSPHGTQEEEKGHQKEEKGWQEEEEEVVLSSSRSENTHVTVGVFVWEGHFDSPSTCSGSLSVIRLALKMA